MHAAAAMRDGGRMLIETAGIDMPLPSGPAAHTLLAITHTGQEQDPEKLFEPSSMEQDHMALTMIHAIVIEHGGYISARTADSGGCRFEVLFPVAATGRAQLQLVPAVGSEAPVILLVEPREHVRVQLHNFFEASGYDLLEAADYAEAAAIAQLHESPLELIIAEAAEADRIELEGVEFLRITDGPETCQNEIRRPFTQQALLERAESLIRKR
jgi:hypothetical protein